MTTNSTAAVSARYVLIVLHVLMTLGLFISNLLLTFDLILLGIHVVSMLALVIYMPACIICTIKNAPTNGFVSGGGEIAYLVIQWLLYLGAAILMTLGLDTPICVQGAWRYNRQGVKVDLGRPVWCQIYLGYDIVSYFHFAVLLGWMIWIAVAAHNVKGMSANKAYKHPAHRLVRGLVAVEPVASVVPVPVVYGTTYPVTETTAVPRLETNFGQPGLSVPALERSHSDMTAFSEGSRIKEVV